MNTKPKLELTWIGKDQRPRLEPRILIEDKTLSYRAEAPEPMQADLLAEAGAKSIHDNLLIQGDNLLALKALESKYAGQVKCVYVDPPFNTQQALPYYEDGYEHSLWLCLIRDRMESIRRLLCEEGTLFVHIDDNELAYLMVLLDEVFGRSNRVSVITFKQGSATGHKSINPGVVSTTNFVLVYAKNKNLWKPNKVFTAREERDTRYAQFIANYEDHFSQWRFTTLTKAFAQSLGLQEKGLKKSLAEQYQPLLNSFVMENPEKVVRLARPDYKAVSSEAREMIDESKRRPNEVLLLERKAHSPMYFANGERILFYKDKLKLIDSVYVAGEPLTSLWDDILSNNLHNEGGVDFPKGKKPEALIKRCLDLATNPGDLVLDSFAGSGTTGAVAHKMGRRWIMVELGEHCHTHIVPRLKKVIDGTDQGGISQTVGWQGGGGFRYMRLAPSLLKKDQWGNWVINPAYNAEMLAEAMCKHMGFTYAPSQSHFWMHGQSSEQDFIYVTTGSLSHDQLRLISEDVGPDRTLLICCKAFMADAEAFPNLTLKKIPRAILGKCEWDHDDYSFHIDLTGERQDEEAELEDE